jgi:hypothetical protein
MISPENEEYILRHAYVPEHVISLMVLISKAEPFLADEFVYYAKDDWIIFVGYPFDRTVTLERCDTALQSIRETLRPEYVWFIGEDLPQSLVSSHTERESDQYYSLDIESVEIKRQLRHVVEKAMKDLVTERSHLMGKEHVELIEEFIKRENPNPRIKALFLAMPDYVRECPTAFVLNAWDKESHLSAFYVVELGAETFATYVVGCHSKKHYTSHASDVLFFEMIRLAQEAGKKSISLGLGVNEGIRRFKKKWGAVPSLKYEYCEQRAGYAGTGSLLKVLMGMM